MNTFIGYSACGDFIDRETFQNIEHFITSKPATTKPVTTKPATTFHSTTSHPATLIPVTTQQDMKINILSTNSLDNIYIPVTTQQDMKTNILSTNPLDNIYNTIKLLPKELYKSNISDTLEQFMMCAKSISIFFSLTDIDIVWKLCYQMNAVHNTLISSILRLNDSDIFNSDQYLNAINFVNLINSLKSSLDIGIFNLVNTVHLKTMIINSTVLKITLPSTNTTINEVVNSIGAIYSAFANSSLLNFINYIDDRRLSKTNC